MSAPGRLLRFWTTFESAVSRGEYLRHGLALSLLKYAGDATLVWVATGKPWTPHDYLTAVPLLATKFGNAPWYVLPALSLWTLPFLWIGVSMTMRRALDAGRSGWLALLFFVPGVNYALIAVLATLPSRRITPARAEPPRPGDERLPGALMAIAAGVAVGLGMAWLTVSFLGVYSPALFLGTPFVLGTLTAFLFVRRYPATRRETNEVVVLTFALVGGFAFFVGAEGMICLLMALPLAVVLGLLGAAFGRALALRNPRLSHAAIAVLALPSAALVDGDPPPLREREVRSSIEVTASPARVWEVVVAFPPLAEPTDLVFRAGIAYPVEARIEGEGVGAIRYCIFSTGAFVEPITHWEPGRRLSFDVAESPPPMREWTLRDHVAPPHLDGFLRPVRGEFRLIPLPGGRTRLEGSTWYDLRIHPAGYWAPISDWLIGRIHDRVLEHIRGEAERGTVGK